MPCKSQVDLEHELIHVTMSGKIAVDAALQFTGEAAKLADKHGYTRLLFDIREIETHPTTSQIFEMATTPENRGLTRKHKRATVFSKNAEGIRFFENVSTNRGYNAACFLDIEAAIEWLTNK